VNYPSPTLVELCGHIGYDWVFIDAEHGPLDLETCENMVRAAETAGIVPIIRLPYPDPTLVNRYLDTGAMGILVPHLGSARQARDFVDATKYHPAGNRGAGSRTRAADFGFERPASEYARWANSETFVMGIVEDADAIHELPGILGTPGIDGVVVGPSDLAQSLGVPGEITHPKVIAAVDEISRQVLASSKALCRVLTSTATAGEDLARFLGMGVPMIAEPFTGLFARGARAILDVRDAGRIPTA